MTDANQQDPKTSRAAAERLGAGAPLPDRFVAAMRLVVLALAKVEQVEEVDRSLAAKEILRLLDAYVVEDGCAHLSEPYMRILLKDFGAPRVFDWMREGQGTAAHLPSCLRLMARVADVDSETARQIVGWALASDRVELREAGVQACEKWRHPALSALLATYATNESAEWLRQYAQTVAAELSEPS